MAVGAVAVGAQADWLIGCGSSSGGNPNWDRLASRLSGRLVRPGDHGYDRDALPFNRRYKDIRPGGIAIVNGPDDIRESVLWARDTGVPLITRSGGHSYGGYSTTEGLIVDLRHMTKVKVDPKGETVRVDAGAHNTDVYSGLQPAGVAISAGRCPTVGISGLALGGGFGFSSRKLGLTSDSLIETEIVTAEGKLIRCNQHSNPDLFWACRGGGGGNFGINTGFRFRTEPVGNVTLYELEWRWRDTSKVVAELQKVIASAPNDFSCRFGLGTSGDGSKTPVINAIGQFFGPRRQLVELLDPALTVAKPTRQLIKTMTFWQAKERLFHNVPRGRFAVKSGYAKKYLSDVAVAALIRELERWPGSSNPDGAGVAVFAWGGKMNEPAPDATAFVHRDALLLLAFDTAWGGADSEKVVRANLDWLDGVDEAIRPHLSGEAYQNFIDPSLHDWKRAYYGSNLERLVKTKHARDPDDFFHFKQSIPTKL